MASRVLDRMRRSCIVSQRLDAALRAARHLEDVHLCPVLPSKLPPPLLSSDSAICWHTVVVCAVTIVTVATAAISLTQP